MSINAIRSELDWPDPFSPNGIGATLLLRQVDRKIGRPLRAKLPGQMVRAGILSPASGSDDTTSTIAIICEFSQPVSDEIIRFAHRLAWNFGNAPVLITIEPNRLRTWSACLPPANATPKNRKEATLRSLEVTQSFAIDGQTGQLADKQAVDALHWIELISGAFFYAHAKKLKPEKCVDRMLLKNLKDIRRTLTTELKLDQTTCHDLLARIIFIQFLHDRKDSEGQAALGPEEFKRLHEEQVLSQIYQKPQEILGNYDDTYRLFRFLDSKFNGDLFPGKGGAADPRTSWENEQAQVRPVHLERLGQFVRGDIQLSDGQLSLWPYYSFDAIPLELISSIYEQFVRGEESSSDGVHYTPPHIVDLMLDQVLPWQGAEWNLRILDPACGSGIFLMKAYQRLVYRWRQAHQGIAANPDILRSLLENSLYGVDTSRQAIRTASFSLYLAMCEEIEPRTLWNSARFPNLQGQRLFEADFFVESIPAFATTDEGLFDLVVGNPPWGNNTVTDAVRNWNQDRDWPIADHNIGPMFLAKGLEVAKNGCSIALLQSTNVLTSESASSISFRDLLFKQSQIEIIINFAPIRFDLFNEAVPPSCAMVLRKALPEANPFWYMSVKPQKNGRDRYQLVIDPYDWHEVYPEDAISKPWIWSALLWGGRRDCTLISRVSTFDNIHALDKKHKVESREGIIRGNSRTKEITEILHRPCLEGKTAREFFPFLHASNLPINENPNVYYKDSTDFGAFNLPQLLIKQSWIREKQRFQAALVQSTPELGGVICSQSYLSVHAPEANKDILDAACLTYNSNFATYFLLLTSGRFAMYRPEAEARDIKSVPLPPGRPGLMDGIETVEQVDARVREAFGFNDAEWILIEDLFHYTLPDFKGDANSPGRQITRRRDSDTNEPDLRSYCQTLHRALKATYGKDAPVRTVIFREADDQHVSLRLISVYLGQDGPAEAVIETEQSAALRKRLLSALRIFLANSESSIHYRRIAHCYEMVDDKTMAIHIIKPDQKRYWLRSMALRDADKIVGDIWTARNNL